MAVVPIMPGQNAMGNPPTVGDASAAQPPPTPDPNAPDCRFPSWAVDPVYFHNFRFSSQYNFTADGVTMIVSNFTYMNNATHLISKTVCVKVLEPADTTELEATTEAELNPEVVAKKTREFWNKVDMVKMVTKVTAGW